MTSKEINDLKREHNRLQEEGREVYGKLVDLHAKCLALQDRIREDRITQSRQRRKQAESGMAAGKRELVRCLGGCGKMFQSENRCTNRICNRCKQRHQEYSGGMAENFSIRL